MWQHHCREKKKNTDTGGVDTVRSPFSLHNNINVKFMDLNGCKDKQFKSYVFLLIGIIQPLLHSLND